MIYVHHYGLVNALGNSPREILANWARNEAPGMRLTEGLLVTDEGKKKAIPFGHVLGDLPAVPEPLRARHNSRNNRLLMRVIESERSRWEALLASVDTSHTGVFLGTSTSGSEEAARYIEEVINGSTSPRAFSSTAQEMGDPARFLAEWLGIRGPAYTICTACTSSARAIITGARLIEAGVIDAAIVGGADSLARMPINGFAALGVLAADLTAPLAAERCGITIGEGVGLMWLSRTPSPIALLGVGESSDAYHMSSPHPEGLGAKLAMEDALSRARLTPAEVDYINLHGTGTLQNDAAECRAVREVFGSAPFVSSTKRLTGHTLGAAGITDALLAVMLLTHPIMHPAQIPENLHFDETLSGIKWITQPTRLTPRTVMSNNFAFGGNNTSLIFTRMDSAQS